MSDAGPAPIPTLSFDKGTVLVRGARPPTGLWDERVGAYRALALTYADLAAWGKTLPGGFEDRALDPLPAPRLEHAERLRPYQKEAVAAWMDGGRRGVIVLPTAAGKTHVALEAMREVGGATLVVVPTIDLIDQWVAKLSEVFGVDVGRLGGGESDIRPVTVSTYDSALIRAESLGNRFQFLVVDEVHHLPSPQYRHIAEMYCAPARLGLTATYERADLLHLELEALMGGKLFERGYEELTDYLADFTLVKVKVELSPEEQEEYDDTHATFIRYLRAKRMVLRGPWDFEAFIRRSWNPEGREALMAWRRSRELAFNPRAKLEAVRTLLSRHRGARTLIFAEQTDQVYDLGRQLLVPCLTYKTPDEERKELLKRFKEGRNTVLATSRVLDEGVDVPEASVAIVLSGSGSPRQFRQRLGRILRPREGKQAILYEVLSRDTSEMGTAARRKRGMGGAGSPEAPSDGTAPETPPTPKRRGRPRRGGVPG
ncbi:MAG: DEAD/DEAH box helicase family protein [Thermoplasmata archaeon]